MEKIVGILGGMGPEATTFFLNKIFRNTSASRDQDHLHLNVIINPKIPDRTAAIYGKGISPLESIRSGINILIEIGSQIISIPCISAHYFIENLVFPPHVKFLNILEVTARYTHDNYKDIKSIGMLGTDLTVRENLFGKYFKSCGIKILYPNNEFQKELVMSSIYEIKSGSYNNSKIRLKKAASHLIKLGAEAIVAGCTEVPLALSPRNIRVPLIDPMNALALAIIKEATT